MNTEIVNPNAEPAPANPPPTANSQSGPEPAPGAEIVSAQAEPSTLNHPSSVVPLTNEDQPLAAPKPGEGGSTTPKHRHRNGHVARLPKEIRQRLNEMLDDGVAYKQIIENLGEHGGELNEDIIYRWKTGGYQDYLREQRLLDQCRLRRDRAFDLLAGASHINGFQATQQLAAVQICETVADLGADTLREALTANPLNYFRMLNSFARLTNGGLKCERYVAEGAERKARLARQTAPRKKGISPESVKEMQDKLNLM